MDPSIKAKVHAHVSERPAAATTLKPKITMRPITTPINILVCGVSSTGKSSFIRTCAQLLNPQGASATAAAAASSTDDSHAVLMAGADDFATTLKPILVPEAGRELVYKFQVRACTLRVLAQPTPFLSQTGHQCPPHLSATSRGLEDQGHARLG